MLRVLDQSVGLTLTSGIHLVVVFYTSSELYQILCRSPICDSVCSIVVDLKNIPATGYSSREPCLDMV